MENAVRFGTALSVGPLLLSVLLHDGISCGGIHNLLWEESVGEEYGPSPSLPRVIDSYISSYHKEQLLFLRYSAAII